MAKPPEDSLRFVPSAVAGLPAATEAVLFPDRLELLSADKWFVIRFLHIARWYRGGWLYRPLTRLGFGVRGRPSVAERDWFHPPSGRFFRFYTDPPITVSMPDEADETSYAETIFRRVQDVIAKGGFSTDDLGEGLPDRSIRVAAHGVQASQPAYFRARLLATSRRLDP